MIEVCRCLSDVQERNPNCPVDEHRTQATQDRRKRVGCDDLDPEWPTSGGKPRGPVLCVCYPNCECGRKDGHKSREIGGDQLLNNQEYEK
jgi:hypothetical protein